MASLEAVPDFISILDADFVPMPNFLTRAMTLFREDDVGVVQTPQHFANPDPMQSNLSLANVWPDEQRYFFDIIMSSKDAWVRRLLLRHLVDHPFRAADGDRRFSHRFGDRGLSVVAQAAPDRLPDGLSERAALARPRSRGPEGIYHPAQPMVPRIRSDNCMGRSGPLRWNNGLRLADRLILMETFLHWSATHSYRLAGLMMPFAYLLFGIEAIHADAADALEHFLPYFFVQLAAIAWLSELRALPIMGDLSQLLAATDICKAVYQGLTKPKGQKFAVTAKGGDRSKLVVQTPLLTIFLTYLVLTIAGVCHAFMLDSSRIQLGSAFLSLFWSWYNVVVLTLACLVCIEQPRLRRSERFVGHGLAALRVDGRIQRYPVKDLSTGGIGLRGRAPAAMGEQIGLVLEGREINATIVRATGEDFALEIEGTFEARAAMIRYVYSGQFIPGVEKIEPMLVAAGLVKRVFR